MKVILSLPEEAAQRLLGMHRENSRALGHWLAPLGILGLIAVPSVEILAQLGLRTTGQKPSSEQRVIEPPRRSTWVTPDTRRRIEQVAAARAFEAVRLAGLIPLDIRPTPEQGIRPGARAFADKVILLEHLADWDTPGFLSRHVAEQLPLFLPLRLRDVQRPEAALLGHCSWLYFGKRRGQYGVVINEAAVRQMFLRAHDAQSYMLYLFLHELGHMLLHRDTLWAARDTGGHLAWSQAGPPTPRMESEADTAARVFANACGITFPEEYMFETTS